MSRPFHKVLIANRGEIAIRIARTAAELGMDTAVLYSEDDAKSAHVRAGDTAHLLRGRGVAAYLDGEQIVATALEQGCEAVHPGYGFLSESASFARRCAHAGLKVIGPRPEIIALYGDKTQARALAESCGVPVPEGTRGPASLEQAQDFLASLGPGGAVMLKAVAGGGGRGMRAVRDASELAQAYARCQSEAKRSFGNDAVYVERFIPRARHIEVQIVGDGKEVSHLWERECTLQRRNQKLVEMAPSPSLSEELRGSLVEAARRMAARSAYENLGTFEFLVDLDRPPTFVFIEANPRIQVEHTVTEEALGLDLVRIQFEIAAGRSLVELSLSQAQIGRPRGYALQLRVNMEELDAQGHPRPSSGTLAAFSPPGGPGVRVDTFGYPGYRTVASFDSLLAKLVVRADDSRFQTVMARARRAAAEFVIEGVATNLPFLRRLLDHPAVAANAVYTRFIEEHMAELAAPQASAAAAPEPEAKGWTVVRARLTGVIAGLTVQVGDAVREGAQLAVLEAMKMEHLVTAETSGIVRRLTVAVGDQVGEGVPIAWIEPQTVEVGHRGAMAALDLDHVREDLAEVRGWADDTLDANRPDAVARRRKRGQRTARENIADLCDEGSFLEYGQFAVAFRRQSHTLEELRAISPADGFVMGLGTVNARAFGPSRAAVAVAAYDFTVFAGTQGITNHRKADRLFELAAARRLPLVLFAEGGGGRPGDEVQAVAGLETPTFTRLARLSGRAPIVGMVSGRCFAGNAALLGLSDVIIATENSNIGMGGPALIEAAGLGAFTPEEVGPIDVQSRNGVVDIRVADEAEAVAVAKRYLAYFQGRASAWEAADPRRLRHLIPASRLRAYDVREAVRLIADVDSFLELRAGFGLGYVTGLVRIEGRPMGLIANNPMHGAGAIDSDGADKVSRFLRLCDAHGLPVLSLVDTPGLMVGPEAEKTALVRHAARLFLTAARLRVPMFGVVLRKAYGLGAMAATGGRLDAPVFTVSWPTGEFGGMSLEGSVRLGYKKQLEGIADPAERKAFFDAKVAALYAQGKALNAASYFELDAVIDPADTRKWLARGLDAMHPAGGLGAARLIDAW